MRTYPRTEHYVHVRLTDRAASQVSCVQSKGGKTLRGRTDCHFDNKKEDVCEVA